MYTHTYMSQFVYSCLHDMSHVTFRFMIPYNRMAPWIEERGGRSEASVPPAIPGA